MPIEILHGLKLREHQLNNLSNDQKILLILKSSKCPLPFNLLVNLTGLSKGHLHRILTSLRKYELVEVSTITKAVFYEIKKQGGSK